MQFGYGKSENNFVSHAKLHLVNLNIQILAEGSMTNFMVDFLCFYYHHKGSSKWDGMWNLSYIQFIFVSESPKKHNTKTHYDMVGKKWNFSSLIASISRRGTLAWFKKFKHFSHLASVLIIIFYHAAWHKEKKSVYERDGK